jgi:hypothetical protein
MQPDDSSKYRPGQDAKLQPHTSRMLHISCPKQDVIHKISAKIESMCMN